MDNHSYHTAAPYTRRYPALLLRCFYANGARSINDRGHDRAPFA